MSWSGPVAGATPYSSQPYTNGQPGYGQQPPYQYGRQPAYGQHPPAPTYSAHGPPQRPPNNQPPKKKGNPVITRYPPPPGYRGPAQPQATFGAAQYLNQYQPPQPGYPQAASVSPAYQSHGYSAPPAAQGFSPQGYGLPQLPNYPQQPLPQAQQHQWPQPGYPPSQGPPQAQNYPGGQGFAPPASNYPGYAPQSAPADLSQQAYGQAPSWPPPNGQAPFPPNQQYVPYNRPPQNGPHGFDPNATTMPATANPATSQPPQAQPIPPSATEEIKSNGKAPLFLAWDDWDFDFEGAIWPKSNEPVDPALSLGVIIWHPAKQMTRALPSTFNEAEEQALKPTPDKLDNGESVSMYFMAENSHEAFLDVRQTDEWESIRDDPIFVVFKDEEMRGSLVSLEDCIAQRDRPDVYTEELRRDDDEEMPDASWSVMDHLEQVLSSTNDPQPKPFKQETQSPPKPSQEDILAKLGVTGVPKPPSDEPIALPFPQQDAIPLVPLSEKLATVASLPSGPQHPPQRAQSYGGHRDPVHARAPQRLYGSMSSGPVSYHPPPPPPPPPEPQRYDSRNQPLHNSQGYDRPRGSPTRSEGSNHTMAGSDFEPEKPSSSAEKQSPVMPALNRSDSSFSRKRSYEDTDHGEEKLRQQDDHTKRKRRSQVDAAYSRR